MPYYACMLEKDKLTPMDRALSSRNPGEREVYPRYRHPNTGIIVVDVLREVNPEKTRLIPLFEANKK